MISPDEAKAQLVLETAVGSIVATLVSQSTARETQKLGWCAPDGCESSVLLLPSPRWHLCWTLEAGFVGPCDVTAEEEFVTKGEQGKAKKESALKSVVNVLTKHGRSSRVFINIICCNCEWTHLFVAGWFVSSARPMCCCDLPSTATVDESPVAKADPAAVPGAAPPRLSGVRITKGIFAALASPLHLLEAL